MNSHHLGMRKMSHKVIGMHADTGIPTPDCFIGLQSEVGSGNDPVQVASAIDEFAFGGSLKPFAVLLRDLRFKAGLTLEQLANAVGVSKPTVWAWEKGRCTPTPDKLNVIANALCVAPQVLGLAAKAERRNLARKRLKKQLGADRETMLTVGRTIIADAYDVDLSAVRIWLDV